MKAFAFRSTIFTLFASVGIFAQLPSTTCRIQMVRLTSPNTLTYSVYLKNTSASTIEYSGGAFHINAAKSWLNAGTGTLRIDSSGLPVSIRPVNPQVAVVNDSMQLRSAAQLPAAAGSGFAIAANDSILVAKYSLTTTSSSMLIDSNPLRWRLASNSISPTTKFQGIVNGVVTPIESACSFINGLISTQDLLSDALSYYPMHIGNYWEYTDFMSDETGWHDTFSYAWEITGDTTAANGKTYKIFRRVLIPFNGYYLYHYERIDSITGSVYRYTASGGFPNNECQIDSLCASVGDVFAGCRQGHGQYGYYRSQYQQQITDTIFGLNTISKVIIDQNMLPWIPYHLTKGIGYSYSRLSELGAYNVTQLQYAKINGVEYGVHIVAVKDEHEKKFFSLPQNYPNPFNPSTTITYQLPTQSKVMLNIYNVMGQLIATLVDDIQPPGKHTATFNAGAKSSAVYFCRLTVAGKTFTRKMLYLK